MYVRPDGRRRSSANISIPKNYSGNAFVESDEPIDANIADSTDTIAEESSGTSDNTEVLAPVHDEKKSFLSGFTDNDDLILLGLILLLSHDGLGDDLLPILLIILFFKK